MSKHDFNIGDKVKLEDGDGRIHIIDSFEEETFRNSIYIRVNFIDKSAIGGISISENNHYTNMIKVE